MLSRNSYGWRRMLRTLKHEGVVCNHKKVRRLMRELNLVPKVKKKFKATTNSNHGLPVEPNRLERKFYAIMAQCCLRWRHYVYPNRRKAGYTWQLSLISALAR